MNPEPVDVVRGVYEALGREDLDGAIAGLSPEIEWVEPECVPWGGVRRGHEGFTSVVEDIGASTEDGRFEPGLRYVGDDHTVAVIGRFSGTVKRTGQQVGWGFVDVWEVRHGLAVRFEAHLDTLVAGRAYSLA